MADSLLGRASHLVHDCIVAVSTPRGRGAVGVVRLSGPHEVVGAVVEVVVGGRLERGTRRLALVEIAAGRADDGADLRPGITGVGAGPRRALTDRGLAVWFAAPGSYTGEDVVELHLHGNPVLLDGCVAACVAAGARAAEPGEFTRRALGNGKLSLLEAEGVDALIRAPGEAAARAARRHLGGELQVRLGGWRDRLLTAAVALEALVDFPEDVGEDEVAGELAALADLGREMEALRVASEAGRRLFDGLQVALVGPVNAGKSTLLNALLGHERAIVSATPGTTRDVVSETVSWGGVAVRLEDTAGDRETTDAIEAAGIARSGRAAELADVVVQVRDGRAVGESDVREGRASSTVRVATHGDLLDTQQRAAWNEAGWLVVDGVRGTGLDAVKSAILASGEATDTGELILHSARQRGALAEASGALAEALDAGAEEPVLCAVAVRRAGRALEELAGAWVDDAVLDELFARFCIGK